MTAEHLVWANAVWTAVSLVLPLVARAVGARDAAWGKFVMRVGMDMVGAWKDTVGAYTAPTDPVKDDASK